MTKMFASRFAQLCFLSASPLALVVAATPATAQAQTRAFDIPAQPLSSAVLEFSRQADVMVVLPPELAAGKRSAAVKGSLSVNAAIAQLLRRTGLRAMPNAAGGYRVAPFAEGRGAARAESATASSGEGTEEIIVTAQKRQERLRDVPVPVTALAAPALAETNLTRIEDYYSRIPSLTSGPGIQGQNLLSLRGLVTGGGNPTVGIVIDDVPFGTSTGVAGGFIVPDLDPSDLAQIEVLRGPQGTLYGASSMGGLVKFVTIEPSTDRVSGRIQGGLSNVRYGETGYNLRGAINLPLAETLAVRASAFVRMDPGYVDNSGLGLKDVNTGHSRGGRIAALWQPTDGFKLDLSALYQRSNTDASSEIFPTLPGRQQGFALNLGGFNREIQAYSARASFDVGAAKLTLLTGYNRNNVKSTIDYTPVFGSLSGYNDHLQAKKFTQEVRAEIPIGDHINWLVGAFYTTENTSYVQRVADFTGRVPGPELIRVIALPDLKEYAAFTNLTVTLSDRFDVQVGARQSHNKQKYNETRIFGAAFGGGSAVAPERTSSDDAFTYLFTPRFKITPELMVYARLASGYRPGGPNTSVVAGSPAQYGSDKTRSYEVGFKGETPDRAFSFEGSLYYIDWKDFQLTLVVPGVGGFNTNGSRARSAGAELSFTWKATPELTFNGWGVYSSAELSERFPTNSTLFGEKGDRLPFSSKWSGNFGATYETTLRPDWEAFANATVAYIGRRLTYFGNAPTPPAPPAARQVLPAYAKLDASLGIKHEGWTATIYVNNLTDSRGLLAGGAGAFNPAAFNYIQPRTVGLSLAKSF